MKKNKDRVLAWQLATSLDKSELDAVSGGAAQGFCSRPTVSVTGTERSWDTSLDIVIDW